MSSLLRFGSFSPFLVFGNACILVDTALRYVVFKVTRELEKEITSQMQYNLTSFLYTSISLAQINLLYCCCKLCGCVTDQ